MFTYNGRGAIFQTMRAVRKRLAANSRRKTVLVPAFHCPTVVDPILHAEFDVRFYAIDEHLNIDAHDMLGKIGPDTAAVLFIRYFGISEVPEALYSAVREAGAVAIDDCSHSFVSANPIRLMWSNADAATFSFWKLLPSLCGGGVVFGHGLRADESSAPRNPGLISQLKHARTLGGQLVERPRGMAADAVRRACMRTPRVVASQPAIQLPAEIAYPYAPKESGWAIPLAARLVLENADLGRVVARRRRNFESLCAGMAACKELTPAYRSLPSWSCPWGFPIFLPRRRERDYLLHARGVPLFTFGEVLHPLLFASPQSDARMVEVSRYLSETLLVLSLHQSLDEEQINQSVELVCQFEREGDGFAPTHGHATKQGLELG